ncbi:MAG TPA: tripartite tricarboxylate transporter substrate binding protein [Burkholderiales bacterium]|nr:tripartite tricarboxylate transporter substrate binding protein [Burkholderiales bacterium]
MRTIAAAALLALGGAVHAAEPGYPTKPIRLLVGFTAGGSADASARVIAARIGQALGTTIVIENRSGAAGAVAGQIAARAAPDGYTLFWSSAGALTVSQILEKNIGYDASAFAPIGRAFTFCNALVARPDFAASSVAQLVALAKSRPGTIDFGSQGVGSAGHLSGALLQNLTGITLTHVPYKGGNDILPALLGGELSLAFASSTTAKGMRSRVKVLAVTSAGRDPGLPDVPSMSEAGVKGYDAAFWFGLLAPARTPQPIVMRLGGLLRDTLADADLTRPLLAQGLIAAPSTPRGLAEQIRADYAKWKRVIGGGK